MFLQSADLYVIYEYILVLLPPVVHVKFCCNRFSSSGDDLKGFTIYGHGSHLGHVKWIIKFFPSLTSEQYTPFKCRGGLC